MTDDHRPTSHEVDLASRQRRFTADVAHELRTPLTGMSATASVLAELLDEMSEPAQRAARLLIGDVERLRVLVADLLELAQLDGQTERGTSESVNLRTLAQAVCAAADPAGGTTFHVDVSRDLVLMSEPLHLRRILANLVENAVVHGGDQAWVRARRDGGGVVVEVVDDGRGVDPAERPRVFDRFYKSNASRSDGGTGLGLSIAWQHAVALGAELSVDDSTGPGARFILRLPDPVGSGKARNQRTDVEVTSL